MNRAMSMNRAQSLASDQDINDGLAEIELQKLQRQYRIMEGDRKAYSEESRILITKQRQTIEKLKADNNNLAQDLKLLESRYNAKKMKGLQAKKAQELNEQAEIYTTKMKQLIPEINELNDKAHELSKHIDSKRVQLGGVHAASANTGAVNKQIKVLENRLDKALVKYNKSLSVNKDRRSIIDNLRRERLMFDNVYRKYEKELMEQKKVMAEIIESSNSAYEARDEAQAKIIAWRERIEKEHQAYVQEIKELDRVLEQDRKLKEFMATKATDRQEKILQAGGVIKTQEPQKRKEKELKNLTSQESLVESLEVYEKAFAEIKRVTDTDDVEKLVQRFKAVEDNNFSLFNYVNEINNEIEELSEEISDAQEKIDKLKVQGVEMDEERKEEMAVLESQLNAALAKNQQYEKHSSDASYSLAEIRKGIDKLVKVFASSKVGEAQENQPEDESSESSFTNRMRFALGTTSITDNNLLQILGVVEHKMNELMTLNYMFSSSRKVASAGSSAQPGTEENPEKQEAQAPKEKDAFVMPLLGTVGGLLGHGPISQVGHLSIVAPSTGDDHDSDNNLSEEEDRPLTRDELKHKTLKTMARRLNGQTIATAKKTSKKGKK